MHVGRIDVTSGVAYILGLDVFYDLNWCLSALLCSITAATSLLPVAAMLVLSDLTVLSGYRVSQTYFIVLPVKESLPWHQSLVLSCPACYLRLCTKESVSVSTQLSRYRVMWSACLTFGRLYLDLSIRRISSSAHICPAHIIQVRYTSIRLTLWFQPCQRCFTTCKWGISVIVPVCRGCFDLVDLGGISWCYTYHNHPFSQSELAYHGLSTLTQLFLCRSKLIPHCTIAQLLVSLVPSGRKNV